MTRRIIYQCRAEVAQVGDTITQDRWYKPLTEPTRKTFLTTAAIVSGGVLLAIPPAPSLGWLASLSDPVHVSPSISRQTDRITASPIAPVAAPEIITADKWLRPLAEPVWPKIALSRAALPVTVGHVSTPPLGAASPEKWFRQLDLKVPPKPVIQASLRQTLIAPNAMPIVAPINTWFRELVFRMWPRKGLVTKEQIAFVAPVQKPKPPQLIGATGLGAISNSAVADAGSMASAIVAVSGDMADQLASLGAVSNQQVDGIGEMTNVSVPGIGNFP
jgi:hypothetical protein